MRKNVIDAKLTNPGNGRNTKNEKENKPGDQIVKK
jgi:hypothetical protein